MQENMQTHVLSTQPITTRIDILPRNLAIVGSQLFDKINHIDEILFNLCEDNQRKHLISSYNCLVENEVLD